MFFRGVFPWEICWWYGLINCCTEGCSFSFILFAACLAPPEPVSLTTVSAFWSLLSWKRNLLLCSGSFYLQIMYLHWFLFLSVSGLGVVGSNFLTLLFTSSSMFGRVWRCFPQNTPNTSKNSTPTDQNDRLTDVGLQLHIWNPCAISEWTCTWVILFHSSCPAS